MTLDDLLQIALPRFGTDAPRGKFIDAVSSVQSVIANRLWLANSDLLRSTVTGTIAADRNKYTFPSGTLGLAERPWVTNSEITPGRELVQLDPARRYTYTETGNPECYEQKGLSLYVYPTASIATTIKAEVFARPTAFETLDEDLPWDGMFDQVFIEATPRFNILGSMVTVTPEMEAFIYKQVDLIIDHRPAKEIRWRYPA